MAEDGAGCAFGGEEFCEVVAAPGVQADTVDVFDGLESIAVQL